MHASLRLASLAVMLLLPTAALAQWRTPWTYEAGPSGPERWGDIDPGYASCKTEQLQSPIDVRGAHRADLPPLQFVLHSGPVRIVNNGYTAVRVDYPAGNGNALVVGSHRYELTQFHFHHPSEELLSGRRYAMNAHFMFKGGDGKVVGVVVFLKPGRANPAVAGLWAHMPAVKGPAQDVQHGRDRLVRAQASDRSFARADRGFCQALSVRRAPAPAAERSTGRRKPLQLTALGFRPSPPMFAPRHWSWS